MITSQEKMHKMILEWGFLPFFINKVEGFSIEEHTPQELWFSEESMASPWEWKGPIITEWDNTYGKFYAHKAGFVSLDWLPDFMNWRRSQYPIDSFSDDARHVLQVLKEHESLLSRELKKLSGFSLARKKKFDPFGIEDKEANRYNGSSCDKILNELQMGTYVVIADFEYNISKTGERYGWGVARYCTPEALFGKEIIKGVEGRTPQESRQRIIKHIKALFPQATDTQLHKLI